MKLSRLQNKIHNKAQRLLARHIKIYENIKYLKYTKTHPGYKAKEAESKSSNELKYKEHETFRGSE